MRLASSCFLLAAVSSFRNGGRCGVSAAAQDRRLRLLGSFLLGVVGAGDHPAVFFCDLFFDGALEVAG